MAVELTRETEEEKVLDLTQLSGSTKRYRKSFEKMAEKWGKEEDKILMNLAIKHKYEWKRVHRHFIKETGLSKCSLPFLRTRANMLRNQDNSNKKGASNGTKKGEGKGGFTELDLQIIELHK